MADTIERKRVTLHPLKDDGTMDLNTNLYPKTFLDGIVNRDGEEVDVVTQPELDEAIDNIEQEIQALPKGDVTEEHLQEVKTDLEDQIDTKAPQEDIDKIWDELDNKLLEYNLRFYWDEGGSNKIVLDSSVEDWMSNSESFNDRLMLISVNGSIPAICRVNKQIGDIFLNFEDFGTIHMNCNGDPTVGENWTINLDEYFPPIHDDSDFYPYLVISNGEVVEDNVIKPHWITSFNDRVDVLSYAPAKAWVRIDDDLEPCTIYRKFSEDKDNIIICIQTSKGEYKLTYQWETDPK